MFIQLFLVLLNYFWLSNDPDESASWYCDQHCFKIGSEVTESVWDAASILLPALMEEATLLGIGTTYRKFRHAPRDDNGDAKGLWHPLSVWHGLCMANMKRGLINASAVFREHTRRTGCIHKSSHDCDFLLKNISRINFNSPKWNKWYSTQNGSLLSSDKKALERKEWCLKHAYINSSPLAIVNRNKCTKTPAPIFVFDECKVEGDDVITSYRKYYHAKIHTISGGMRYYYTPVPKWLQKHPSIKTVRGKKVKKYLGPVDSEGYAIIIFVD